MLCCISIDISRGLCGSALADGPLGFAFELPLLHVSDSAVTCEACTVCVVRVVVAPWLDSSLDCFCVNRISTWRPTLLRNVASSPVTVHWVPFWSVMM